MAPQAEEIAGVDFAVAVYREGGVWRVDELAHDRLADVETLTAALRRFPSDGGAAALIGIDEDFFVVCRVNGASVRLLLSDLSAAEDWEFAESVVDALGLPAPVADSDSEEADGQPAGDLGIFADAGFSAIDMAVLLENDFYPDEALSEMADRIGFGELFDDAVGLGEE